MDHIQIVVIPADPYEPMQERAIERLDIDAMQGIVGGLFDCARARLVPDDTRTDFTVYVNDEGLLTGLPANERATRLAWAGGYGGPGETLLVGDAFVTGGVDAEGNTLSIPPDVRRLLV